MERDENLSEGMGLEGTYLITRIGIRVDELSRDVHDEADEDGEENRLDLHRDGIRS